MLDEYDFTSGFRYDHSAMQYACQLKADIRVSIPNERRIAYCVYHPDCTVTVYSHDGRYKTADASYQYGIKEFGMGESIALIDVDQGALLALLEE